MAELMQALMNPESSVSSDDLLVINGWYWYCSNMKSLTVLRKTYHRHQIDKDLKVTACFNEDFEVATQQMLDVFSNTAIGPGNWPHVNRSYRKKLKR